MAIERFRTFNVILLPVPRSLSDFSCPKCCLQSSSTRACRIFCPYGYFIDNVNRSIFNTFIVFDEACKSWSHRCKIFLLPLDYFCSGSNMFLRTLFWVMLISFPSLKLAYRVSTPHGTRSSITLRCVLINDEEIPQMSPLAFPKGDDLKTCSISFICCLN